MYDRSEKEIDDVAWRIRLFGQVPFSNFSDYLKHSSVKEAKGNLTSYEMAKEVLADIRILLEILEQGILAATEINDKGSELLLQSITFSLEKEYWMLTEWMKQDRPSV